MDRPYTEKAGKQYNQKSAALESARKKEERSSYKHLEKRY